MTCNKIAGHTATVCALVLATTFVATVQAAKPIPVKVGDLGINGFHPTLNKASGAKATIDVRSTGGGFKGSEQQKVWAFVEKGPEMGYPLRSVSISSPHWLLRQGYSYSFSVMAKFARPGSQAMMQFEWWADNKERPTYSVTTVGLRQDQWLERSAARFVPPDTARYRMTISFLTTGKSYLLDEMKLMDWGKDTSKIQTKPVRYYGRCGPSVNGMDNGNPITIDNATQTMLNQIAISRMQAGGSLPQGKDSNVKAYADIPSDAENLLLDNGVYKVGLDMGAGASIWYLSGAKSNLSVINGHDVGRRIQQSFYGAPDGSTFMGIPWVWNPVQAGSMDNQPGRVLRTVPKNPTTYSVAQLHPRNWAGLQLLTDVLMRQVVNLYDTHVHIRMIMRYTGEQEHPPSNQELPAFFVARHFNRMLLYEGNRPWTNARMKGVFPCTWWEQHEVCGTGYTLPEKMVIWQNTRTRQAVGVMSPSATGAYAYRFGHNDNVADPHAGPTSYVAPIAKFGIKPGGTHIYDVYVAMGTVQSIRQTFEGLHCMERDAGRL